MRPSPLGVYCPVITPLDTHEELDATALVAQLERLDGQVDGLMLLGTTGELPLVSSHVADRLVEVVAEHAGHLPLMLGIGGAGAAGTWRNMRRLRPEIDYVSVCSPYYYPVPAAELERYYRDVADRAPVPVVLYNIPQNTHQTLPVDIVATLSGHENVAGIKDSSGDRAYFRRLLDLAGPSFTILQGSDETEAETWYRQGVDGYVSGLENVAPGTLRTLTDALAGDDAHALEQAQSRLRRVAGMVGHGFWLTSIKAAVSMIVGGTGAVSAPLPRLTAKQRRALRRALVDLELLPAEPAQPLS